MSKSVLSSIQCRVQKICTLWTHDENFSRDDIVYNSDKFPELPTTPGSLLQIVAINSGTAVRDFSSTTKIPPHDIAQARVEPLSKDAHDTQSRKSRRGSVPKTLDEHASTAPGGRDVDAERTYIFASKPLPQTMRSKHPNLQISISEKIAKVFGFRNRMQVVIAEADEARHEAHHVELVFRDEYLARADMWRMAISELSKRTIYRGQKLLFMGTIKATVKQIYIDGRSVHSGYFSPTTKPIFRSESARYVLFIQMSKEMWDFDAEGAGEIMFNKVVGGFLPDLFKRWLRINAKHVVTIILFTRMQYDEAVLMDHADGSTTHSDMEPIPGNYRDFYRVVVSDMASGDWIKILHQLKLEFRVFLREVSLLSKSTQSSENTLDYTEAQDLESNTVIAGKPSSASQGNILEAINLAAAQFAKDHIDRDLVRTGISVIVITPGTGVFEVDYNMLKLTTDTLIGSGIGIDLVCLSPMPLHSVPLFKYRTPSPLPDSINSREGVATGLDERTPKQNQPNFGSVTDICPTSPLIGFGGLRTQPPEMARGWKFAMPYWVDISFWSRPTDDVLELTKTRIADKVIKRSHKKHRSFALRCRLYELQMMGVIENELGDISLPYLDEEHSSTDAHRFSEAPKGDADTASAALDVAGNANGSLPSVSDQEQLDSKKSFYKAWMDDYDTCIFFPNTELSSEKQSLPQGERTQSYSGLTVSPELSRGSSLSTSYHSTRTLVARNARLSPDIAMHQPPQAKVKRTRESSPRSESHRLVERNLSAVPRADVLRRQRATESTWIDNTRALRGQGGPRDPIVHRETVQTAPNQSIASSREHSPPRRTGLPPISVPSGSTSVREVPKPRPSNWFLRQISFAGKAAPAKPTLGDATTDISQGNVKPAMLTIEKSQKGAIAERLASTRLSSTEKPSQPITIRSSSRIGVSSIESPPPDQSSRSVDTVRGMHSRRTSAPSQSSSVKKDPGSTFLLAGGRIIGEPKQNLDLSTSGGGKDALKTLSPTSAIAPWAVLVNPCNPKKNILNTMNQYRRWHHVFPRTVRTGTMKWRSLCSPAAVPLTHEWFPTADQLSSEYNESPYKITQSDEDDMLEAPKTRETLIRELVAFRLSHGFQIITGAAVAEFSGRHEKTLAGVLAPEYMASDGDTVFMTVGTSIHQLVCIAGGEVEVKRYHRKPTISLESSAGVDVPFSYRPYIRTAYESSYDPRDIVLHPPRREFNWNFIDTFLAGYHDEFSDVLRFWRARFVLIPVDIPSINRRPLPMLAEDSEEEVRLEGIRKLTQLWQRYRYLPPEERFSHDTNPTRQKDPNPLAIEYHTRDPSAVVAAGPVNTLFNHSDSELPASTISEADKYHTSNIDLRKLAEDLQGEKGIQMLDRRWHWKLHYNCFLGFDLTNWLLSNFTDVDSRESAVELGNQLMQKGLFQHVQRRHPFRDGNFFFQIAMEYRAPRPESRAGWFGLRKTDKSVPSTPLLEGPRTSPLIAKGIISRPSTAESSSNTSDSVREGEKTPTQEHHVKRKVTLSRAMRYDVDPRKRSYRSEIISLHYDLVHNPDNCYHIRIDWMNVTAKLIEDAIVTWATSVEKYGLKLVEVPIGEAANIMDYHPFRSPYHIKLSMQPPQNQTDAVWDSMHFSPQYLRTDKFAYHKALLRKLNFVLDMEAASAFPADIDVSYSWGSPDYKYTQFIHRTGTLLAQITEDGNFLVLANRLAHNRAKDMSRIRPLDLHEHKKVTTDGGQSSRIPSTPTVERTNPHRSPFSSPLARPVQDSSLLHTALEKQAAAQVVPTTSASLTPEQVKDELETFCANPALLSQFYNEAFKQAPSPSPRILPVLDNNIPSLGLPPAISIREASPANTGWALGSNAVGRSAAAERIGGISEMSFSNSSGLAGRRQGSEGSMSTLGKRGSITETGLAGSLPRRQDSQGSGQE